MNSTVCLLLLLCYVLCLVLPAARSEQRTREELVLKAKARREATWLQREAEYHKQLATQQKTLVASIRASNRPIIKDPPTNPNDKEAVVALYHFTNGPKWLNSTGWLQGDPCKYPFWFGLYCIDGRILQINLVDNGLDGSIPPDLARASALQVIRLYSNLLTGSIPSELFDLQSLQILDVNDNSISGTLPSRISMPKLTQLVLYSNKMEGSFPSSISAPMLQIIEVSTNSFTGALPDDLSGSPNLTDLVVSRNRLTGDFPPSYGKLVRLQRLWTFYNWFDQPVIPNEYQSMTELVEIQSDSLSGPLSSWIGTKWTKMKNLVLVNGKLSGNIPDSFCLFSEMNMMRLFNNSLSGSLPKCLCDMTKLTDLELSDNQLTGDIPDTFSTCQDLENLHLSRNQLTGEFPSSTGSLENLSVLDISQNGLYGSIPNTINGLKDSIAEFAISYNMFSDVDSGADAFFNRIIDYSCLFYNNPWSCPLTYSVPKECSATCSDCNAKVNRGSCSDCIAMQKSGTMCGWCDIGNNCLEGKNSSVGDNYICSMQDWKYIKC